MTNIDIHHNLTMNNSHRNPLLRTKSTRIVNNLCYNHAQLRQPRKRRRARVDIIGNKYKRGPVDPIRTWHEIQAFAGNSTLRARHTVYLSERQYRMASDESFG